LILSEGQNGGEGEQEEGWRVLNKVLDLLDSVAKVRCHKKQLITYNSSLKTFSLRAILD